MKRVTPESLAAALATLNGGAPVEVRPASMSIDGSELDLHHKAVAAAVYAALPDEPDALREALDRLFSFWDDVETLESGPPHHYSMMRPEDDITLDQLIEQARAALAADAAGEGGEG